MSDVVERLWRGELGAAGMLLDAGLTPAAALFRAVSKTRNAAFDAGLFKQHRVNVPVISVGNLTVGGTGKTPFAAWLVETLTVRGARPALLHGGYGQDEPALHRIWHPDVPVYAGKDRIASAHAAIAAGATVLVLDDGFQHRRLARDVDIVLIAAESWTAPKLLPRGPWREHPGSLARAGVIAVTRRSASRELAGQVMRDAQRFAPEAVRLTVAIAPAGWTARDGREAAPPERAIGVTAIAQPQIFAHNAASAGVALADLLVFRDHHDYTTTDVEQMRARAAGLPIVTTAKDWVKLEPLLPDAEVFVLQQRVVVESGEAQLQQIIDRVLAA